MASETELPEVPESAMGPEIENPPAGKKGKKGLVIGIIAVVVVILALLGAYFYSFGLNTTAFTSRVRILPVRVEQGQNATLTWSSRKAAFPKTRIYICPVTRLRAESRNCKVAVVSTDNDGKETFKITVAPGTYRPMIQMLDQAGQPVNKISMTGNGFRVLPGTTPDDGGSDGGDGGSGGGDGGGSGDGGSGDGGTAPTPTPPPPPYY